MLWGSARQTKGRGLLTCSLMKRLMVAWKSTTDWKTPFFRRRRVSLAKKPSAAFSHELDVGGTVRISVCGRAVEHYAAMALMKRSPKMTANQALAMVHSRGGIFHSFCDRFKIR